MSGLSAGAAAPGASRAGRLGRAGRVAPIRSSVTGLSVRIRWQVTDQPNEQQRISTSQAVMVRSRAINNTSREKGEKFEESDQMAVIA